MRPSSILVTGKITEETRLYRYIKLSQFMSWVETGKTYLTKVKHWKDIWEVPVTKLESSENISQYAKKQLPETIFGQCWSLNGESDALWRIYSTSKEGLLIQTRVKNFKKITEIKLGMLAPIIYYKSLEEGIAELARHTDYHKLFGQAFLKRAAFEHEKEVRLVTINNSDCLVKKFPDSDHIYLSLNPIDFVDNIITDPRSSDWYVDTVQSYCLRAGFNFVPSKSDLYSTDVYAATHLTETGE